METVITTTEVVNPAAQAAALWAGLHLLLLLVLSVLVVRARGKHKVLIGHGDVPAMELASRAFGNAIEYVPAILAALAVMAAVGVSALAVHVTGGVLLVARVLHAAGISRSGGVSAPRLIGTALTWLAYLFAAVVLLFYALG